MLIKSLTETWDVFYLKWYYEKSKFGSLLTWSPVWVIIIFSEAEANKN